MHQPLLHLAIGLTRVIDIPAHVPRRQYREADASKDMSMHLVDTCMHACSKQPGVNADFVRVNCLCCEHRCIYLHQCCGCILYVKKDRVMLTPAFACRCVYAIKAARQLMHLSNLVGGIYDLSIPSRHKVEVRLGRVLVSNLASLVLPFVENLSNHEHTKNAHET